MKAHLILILTLTFLSSSFLGCSTIGVKRETIIVYTTLGKHDAALNGLIRVATNKPIPVTVNDISSNFNAGGYYLVHGSDLKKLNKRVKGL